MEVSQGSLLQPSLQGVGAARAPYSVKTLFITAFFGGPIAAIAIMAVNAVRLRRLIRDLAPILLALAAYVGFMTAVVATDWGAEFQRTVNSFAEGGFVFLHRALALAFFGLAYLLHRKEQRGADIAGLDRPNGLIAGGLCIAGGIGLLLALDALSVGGTAA